MTPRQQAQSAGFDSVAEVVKMVGKPATTLLDWAAFNKPLFRAVLLGCERIRKEGREGSKW